VGAASRTLTLGDPIFSVLPLSLSLSLSPLLSHSLLLRESANALLRVRSYRLGPSSLRSLRSFADRCSRVLSRPLRTLFRAHSSLSLSLSLSFSFSLPPTRLHLLRYFSSSPASKCAAEHLRNPRSLAYARASLTFAAFCHAVKRARGAIWRQ
jgi:hypothetical protein